MIKDIHIIITFTLKRGEPLIVKTKKNILEMRLLARVLILSYSYSDC